VLCSSCLLPALPAYASLSRCSRSSSNSLCTVFGHCGSSAVQCLVCVYVCVRVSSQTSDRALWLMARHAVCDKCEPARVRLLFPLPSLASRFRCHLRQAVIRATTPSIQIIPTLTRQREDACRTVPLPAAYMSPQSIRRECLYHHDGHTIEFEALVSLLSFEPGRWCSATRCPNGW
jgi:hypothetical protein